MPGNIRVAVLEVVDLPASVTAGKSVAVKVAVGKREFQTTPADAEDGRTQPWNSEFLFPVLNLRDNLVVAILDSNGDVVARAELETPGIVQKGFQDEFIALKAGGRVHMKVSFVLSEEERRKIDAMRLAAIRRKKGFNQPNSRSRHQAPVSNVKITEITSEEAGDPVAETKCMNEDSALRKDTEKKSEEISSPVLETEVAPECVDDTKPPLTPENKARSLKPEAEWKPSIALKVEKLDKRREVSGASKAPVTTRKPVEKQDENITPEDLKPKSQGFQWLSGKLRSDQSKPVESGRYLEDLKLKSKNDKLKAMKAARADEWIKQLEKTRDQQILTQENKFRDEGLVLKKHIQEEEKKVKTLGRKTEPREMSPSLDHRTVAQKLEEWKIKESGPWRRNSRVQHASPPDADQQQVARWILKGTQKTKAKTKTTTTTTTATDKTTMIEAKDFPVNVTIEQPELMAAADKMWASSLYSEHGSSPSMSPESRKKHSGSIKGLVKQVLSGAAALAGSFSLWSRKGSSKAKKKEKFHVVKEGETLSSIVPGEWDDPESEFYRLNPEIRDMHSIYPGQRLRLRA